MGCEIGGGDGVRNLREWGLKMKNPPLWGRIWLGGIAGVGLHFI